jgi:hypothetical protein
MVALSDTGGHKAAPLQNANAKNRPKGRFLVTPKAVKRLIFKLRNSRISVIRISKK